MTDGKEIKEIQGQHLRPDRSSVSHEITDNLDVQSVVEGNNTFAFELYAELRKIEGNLFFSPHSISTALAMTYAGARENTANQMAQTLHFALGQAQPHSAFAEIGVRLRSVHQESGNQLNIANALWPQAGYAVLEEFIALLKEYYRVSITPVDYEADTEAARKTINTWVAEKTQEKIKELIKERILDSLTRLVLVNAIYFKGTWASQFDKSYTQNAPFRLTSEESIEVPMMAQTQRFQYYENNRFQILELPYVGHTLSMILLLPQQIDGLTEFEKTLTLENLQRWTGRLRERKVEVILPKFRLNSQFRLDSVLQSLGMVDAFKQDKANFAGIDGNEARLYIAAVIHQAFVNVDEEGTEATAATAVVIKARSAYAPPPTFRADHPFVFLIRDNDTGSILFIGRVAEPEKIEA